MKCFYHNADLDGRCSGAIVKLKFPDCVMIGINYGDPFPWDLIQRDEVVFMVDFCLQPFEDMERLDQLCSLHWIDHHKTSLEGANWHAFEAGGFQLLEIGRAGCELTWEALFPHQPMPTAVGLLGRYDVWDHTHEGVVEFQYGMRQQEADPENTVFWNRIFYGNIENIIQVGALLLAYEKRQNEIYAKSCSFEVELDGLRCIAANKGLTNSLLFDSVWDPERHDAMLTFVFRKGSWKVSLYSNKPEVDVSAVCKARGGGGHKGAAGFQCDSLPFL